MWEVGKALRKSRFAASMCDLQQDNPGAEPRVNYVTIADTLCLASPKSRAGNERDENEQSQIDRELCFARFISNGVKITIARKMVNDSRCQNLENNQKFLREQGVTAHIHEQATVRNPNPSNPNGTCWMRFLAVLAQRTLNECM